MKLGIIVIALFYSWTLKAQIQSDLRAEVEVNSGTENYFVIPTGSYGLVLFGEGYDIDKQTPWEFTFYDGELKKISTDTMKIDRSFYYKGYYFDDDKNVYVFFGSPRADEYELVAVNAETRKVTLKTGALPKKFYMDEFKVYKNTMYLAGNVKNDLFLCSVDLSSMSMTPYPINYDGYNNVKNIDISAKEDEVNIVVSNLEKKKGVVYIQTFKDGKRMKETLITPKEGYNLIDGKVNHIGKNTKVVIGTYAIGKGGASGMYYCKLEENNQTVMTYYNFTDFSNFFNFLPASKKEKVEKKIAKSEEKGKEVDLSYSLIVHDLIARKDELILVAEAYYPTYRTEFYTATETDANGHTRTVSRTRQVFNGWVYSHAIVAGFDAEGKKVWDNTFEMGDFRTFEVKERVAVKINESKEIELVYGYGAQLRSKAVVGNNVVDKKQTTPIKDDPNSKVKYSSVSDIAAWYGDYFLASGIQIIKEDEKGKKKHKVFYFTRLKYT